MNRRLLEKIFTVVAGAFIVFDVDAQTVLDLQQCRDLAVANNKELKMSEEDISMASYDSKIAKANYFPKISATGMYMYNSGSLSLLNENSTAMLSGLGTTAQSSLNSYLTEMMSNPGFITALGGEPALQALLSKLSAADISSPLNVIGSKVAEAFDIDIHNVFAGVVTLEQPIYVGGKIRAYNLIAQSAEALAQSQHDTEYQKIITTTDEAYWQIVSIANKLKLAEGYHELLQKLDGDVEKMINEGVATKADELSVKVKLNEAEMTLIKAQNGLVLSKMLLCQLCGLELTSDITLVDETLDDIAVPTENISYTEEEIFENRAELRSLTLASEIYNRKVDIARSDFLPSVALMGNYLITNPSATNGIENKFAGMWNVGVAVKVPIFHWREGGQQVNKARAEARKYDYQLQNAKEQVLLQVKQYEQKITEADAQLAKSTANVENAEENLRVATLGFKEGVITTNTVTEAQTAWLQARSNYIDAKIDRIMSTVYLKKAVGALE